LFLRVLDAEPFRDSGIGPERRCLVIHLLTLRKVLRRRLDQGCTSKITSSSTGVPSGRLATPYTKRQGFLSFPKTSCSNSEAASATFGRSRTSPEVAT